MKGFVLVAEGSGDVSFLETTLPFRLLRSKRAAKRQAELELKRDDDLTSILVVEFDDNGYRIDHQWVTRDTDTEEPK